MPNFLWKASLYYIIPLKENVLSIRVVSMSVFHMYFDNNFKCSNCNTLIFNNINHSLFAPLSIHNFRKVKLKSHNEKIFLFIFSLF